MRTLSVILLVVAVFVVGWLAVKSFASKGLPSARKQTLQDLSQFDANDETALATSDSKYIEYTKNSLLENKDKRRVLFFYANWCPICRPADVEFQAHIRDIPSDVVLIRVNYNDDETDKDEEALAKKYGITYQHTFVQIDENGEVINRWNGGGIDDLLSNIQ